MDEDVSEDPRKLSHEELVAEVERLRHQQANSDDSGLLQAILDLVPHRIYAADSDGLILLANATAAQAFGATVSEVVGKPLADHFKRPQDCAVMIEVDRQVLDSGEAMMLHSESFVDSTGQSHRAQTSRTPFVFAPNGRRAVLSVGVDVVGWSVDPGNNIDAKIRQAQKLESLGVLAGGIAHDFNNLLMGVLGNVGIALAQLPPESPLLGTLKSIELSAQNCSSLTKQMLAYSGKGSFVVEAINLNLLIEDMANLLKVSISKKAVLKFSFAEHPVYVDGDATQLRQVVMNLITNASDAIDARSGVISISTGIFDADRDYLAHTLIDDDLPEGTYAFIEVSDTGIGMSRETIGKMFDPFFTTKFTGRGLGLAAVQGIVRGHQGALRVYSELDRGSTIKIVLPASAQTPNGNGKNREILGDFKGEGTALVVDDEETVRGVVKQMLTLVGFEVVTAVDGLEALDIYRERKDEISLVLLDLTMPNLNGEEAHRELRRIDKDVRCILMSGYNEHDVTDRFAGKGLVGFIQKPFTPRGLYEVVRQAFV